MYQRYNNNIFYECLAIIFIFNIANSLKISLVKLTKKPILITKIFNLISKAHVKIP